MDTLNHEHPLKLIDLQPLYPCYEVVYSDDEEREEVVITKKGFRCPCDGCGEEITYFHRYYYRCDSCNYSFHKFCGSKPPETLELASHPHHTLAFSRQQRWPCAICSQFLRYEDATYHCVRCYFCIHLHCVAKEIVKNETIYHPSHRHPLKPTSTMILANCYACGKEHKGIFFLCTICYGHFLIHKDCAFLSIELSTTHHHHPLLLAYSFPSQEQSDKIYPKCRVCDESFYNVDDLWIYKCEKCRYYTHLDCATSRKEPFMSIFMKPGIGNLRKNFKDVDHPNLLHLLFLDQTYSILKHLFFKETEPRREHESREKNFLKLHEHPLIQVDTQPTRPTSSRTTTLSSCHDPIKNVLLLCNGCVRPINRMPFYKCSLYDHEEHHCNFVIHEWCTRLPNELKDHPLHQPQHKLVLVTSIPHKAFGVFLCDVCGLRCNGFSYSCIKCESYYIDVNCGFIPKHITHESHPNHLLSIGKIPESCRMCGFLFGGFSWSCQDCDFDIHIRCALLLPKTIRCKYDKHPMELMYFPVENHKSDYFCEVCESELDPNWPFYHCCECAWSVHTTCATLTLQGGMITYVGYSGVYDYMNMKFGGIHKIEDHTHPLMLLEGNNSECSDCGESLIYYMMLKCLECNFAVHQEEWCRKNIMND